MCSITARIIQQMKTASERKNWRTQCTEVIQRQQRGWDKILKEWG